MERLVGVLFTNLTDLDVVLRVLRAFQPCTSKADFLHHIFDAGGVAALLSVLILHTAASQEAVDKTTSILHMLTGTHSFACSFCAESDQRR